MDTPSNPVWTLQQIKRYQQRSMEARTGRWSDPGAPRRWVGSSSIEGVRPAASAVTWSWADLSDERMTDEDDERMTDEDVVDQLLASSVDSAKSLRGRDARGEVPQPLRVTVVGAVKAGGTNLRAGRPVDDLSSGRTPPRR